MKESEKAWLRYQEACREGDRLAMSAVIAMGGSMILFALLGVVAALVAK